MMPATENSGKERFMPVVQRKRQLTLHERCSEKKHRQYFLSTPTITVKALIETDWNLIRRVEKDLTSMNRIVY